MKGCKYVYKKHINNGTRCKKELWFVTITCNSETRSFTKSLNSRSLYISDLSLRREPTMSDDLFLDTLSPRDNAIPMDRVLSRQSNQRNYI